MNKWERTTEAKDLMDEVERAIKKIHRFVGTIPQSAFLPDFSVEAVVAFWELKVPKATTTHTPPLREHSFPVSNSTTLQILKETTLNFHPRTKVRPRDLEKDGKYRGESFHVPRAIVAYELCYRGLQIVHDIPRRP